MSGVSLFYRLLKITGSLGWDGAVGGGGGQNMAARKQVSFTVLIYFISLISLKVVV